MSRRSLTALIRASLSCTLASTVVPGCTGESTFPRFGSVLASPAHTRGLDPDDRPYPEVSFAATHNSYAGALGGGDVASLSAQLDRGVRMIELDVHDDEYTNGGYRVGHLFPGNGVYFGDDNPRTDHLEAWLRSIERWSSNNPRHAPITLLLDLKDNVGDNRSTRRGDLTALNGLLLEVLGERLFSASEVDTRPWPTVAELRGRVIVVLSGDETSRIAYRGDRGVTPAVAMNDRGEVIEVHDNGDGELWYWAGHLQPDGTVRWIHHAAYDTGKTPAIDLNNDGVVVEVHQDPDLHDDQLWYRVGRLGPDLEIRWLREEGLELPGADEGNLPSVRFLSKDGLALREIHRSPNTGLAWLWDGTFDAATGQVRWTRGGRSGRTKAPRFDKNTATSKQGSIEVFTGADGAFGADTLLYGTSRAGPARIRPFQLAFVELQMNSATQLEKDGLLFYSGPASSLSARLWAIGWRTAGKVSRLWSFNEEALTAEASVNFPATDLPFTGWYDGYREALSAAR